MRLLASAPNGILQVMYSYRHSRTCLCPDCVRGEDTSADRALDASVARLAASMTTAEPPFLVTSLGELRRAIGKAPWEMSGSEFDAAAALRVVRTENRDANRNQRLHQSSERTLGLKRSYLRAGMELRLDVEWGPPGGYVVFVSQDDEATLNDPRRSFVKGAIDKGIVVAPELLAAYPDLSNPSVG